MQSFTESVLITKCITEAKWGGVYMAKYGNNLVKLKLVKNGHKTLNEFSVGKQYHIMAHKDNKGNYGLQFVVDMVQQIAGYESCLRQYICKKLQISKKRFDKTINTTKETGVWDTLECLSAGRGHSEKKSSTLVGYTAMKDFPTLKRTLNTTNSVKFSIDDTDQVNIIKSFEWLKENRPRCASVLKKYDTLIPWGEVKKLMEKSTDIILDIEDNDYALVKWISFTFLDEAIHKLSGNNVNPSAETRIAALQYQVVTDLYKVNKYVLCIKLEDFRNTIIRTYGIQFCEKIIHDEVIQQGNWIYLKKWLGIEKNIADRISKIMKMESIEDEIDGHMENYTKNSILTSEQISALQMAISKPFSIINGSAGTGKTTVLKFLINILQQNGISFRVLAFSGKAVERIKEVTQCPNSTHTIHKMIWYYGFHNNCNCKISGSNCPRITEADMIIVDEASMVDAELLSKLLTEYPDSRYVFVGDTNQLPPIGRGYPFANLISQPMIFSVTTLIYNRRSDISIHEYANTIFSNPLSIPSFEGEPLQSHSGVTMMKLENGNKDIRLMLMKTLKCLVEIGYTQDTVQVLFPQKHFSVTQDQNLTSPTNITWEFLNREMRAVFRLSGRGCVNCVHIVPNWKPEVISGCEQLNSCTWRVGDKVICSKNIYEELDYESQKSPLKKAKISNDEDNTNEYAPARDSLKLANGSVGKIVGIRNGERISLCVNFPISNVQHNFTDSTEKLYLGYGITVHKSQGSEYEATVLVLPNGTWSELLHKNLLYTAVTRGKKKVVIVYAANTLDMCLSKNIDESKYKSNIVERITEILQLDL